MFFALFFVLNYFFHFTAQQRNVTKLDSKSNVNIYLYVCMFFII